MHVLFVSACTKRSIKRTRSILDRYATRMSDFTWSTPVTMEGLATIRTLLRAGASRNTAVACLRNDGNQGMRIIWVVGVRERFGEDGRAPVFITSQPIRLTAQDKPGWITIAKKIAAISGLFHDLGKNNQFFAKKLLSAKPLADPIRHEWISTLLVESFLLSPDQPAEQAWESAMSAIHGKQKPPIQLQKGVDNASQAILACVATHHRLFSEEKNSLKLDDNTFRNNVTSDLSVIDPLLNRQMQGSYGQEIEADVRKAICDVAALDAEKMPDLYWRAIAFLSRSALILADHRVSSVNCEQPSSFHSTVANLPKTGPFANSVKDKNNKRKYNQTLQWHLQNVGQEAAAMLDRMMHLHGNLPGLSPEAVESIDADATGRFAWQQQAAESVRRSREEHGNMPMLLAVISGTGSGKTRACARLACCSALHDKVRFATLLNLRTLTLQTGDAYADQLNIPADEMAVVIGDAMSRKAYESQKNADTVNEDGMDASLGEDIDIRGDVEELPEWLEHFVKDNNNLSSMIGAPVFVATADYLVPAGEPNQQARHIMPLLRLMSSDLILDEIDNYDSKSVVAILRLVQLAGLFGRNVIASSATLTQSLAQTLYKFYAHGAAMRAALYGWSAPKLLHGIICDTARTILVESTGVEAFAHDYEQQTQAIKQALASGQAMRLPELIPVGTTQNARPTEADFLDAVTAGVLQMHGKNSWSDPDTGKQLSVGLVRVANIKTAMAVAQRLRNDLSAHNPKVACYHSNLFNGHRMLIERDLDFMLSRGSDPDKPATHKSVSEHMNKDSTGEGLFIVVATPVEEVGRDHDFDWAVIEPSSTQSIVQTAGRVRRHRKEQPQSTNVGILQFNFRYCRSRKLVFTKPGNESTDRPYRSHDLNSLVNWDALKHGLDARLRFDVETHTFANFDEAETVTALAKPLKRMTGERPNGKIDVDGIWLSDFTYRNWPLRENNMTDTWRYYPEEEIFKVLQKSKVDGEYRFVEQDSTIDRSQRIVATESHWLCPTVVDIIEECERIGVSTAWGLEFSISVYNSESPYRLCWSLDGFSRLTESAA
jgi:CRISPR-associated endonuclease/helicase Cas3